MLSMGKRLTNEDKQYLRELERFDHTAAHMVAEEYTWSWATCWFADEGEFNHWMMTPREGSYATMIDWALFGWWAASGECEIDVWEIDVRAKMLAYLRDREARNEMGPVEGFKRLWRGE
jgi:hypothetical protein